MVATSIYVVILYDYYILWRQFNIKIVSVRLRRGGLAGLREKEGGREGEIERNAIE